MKTATRTYCVNHPNARVLRRGLCGICYQKLGETGALLGVADPPPKRPKVSRPKKPRPRQTHCIHGHELTDENVSVSPAGGRTCRECSRIRSRKRAAARRVGTGHREEVLVRARLLSSIGWSNKEIAELIGIANRYLVRDWLAAKSLPRVRPAEANVWCAVLDDAITQAYRKRDDIESLPPYLKGQKRGEGDG